jgi:electron transport complex protein RnfD
MGFSGATSPYIKRQQGVAALMRQVLIALIPGTAVLTAFFGIGVLTNLVLASAFALSLETLAVLLRGQPPGSTLNDGSALITAWLLALALPPLSPWWLIAIATLFAIIVAKHLYGGLGHNPFNPAMVGYAAVLISFPVELTAWIQPIGADLHPPGLGASLGAVFLGSGAVGIDGATAATALDVVRNEVASGRMLSELTSGPAFGPLGARGSEWAGLAFLCGGLWLLYKRVIDWRIPLSMLAALTAVAALLWMFDAEIFASPLFHLFGGAALLGAFFVATDPVSASTTPLGRIWYGAGIGILTYVIRAWGGYPDGVAFAVLLMNLAAPTIDYFTRPRIYGHQKRPDG